MKRQLAVVALSVLASAAGSLAQARAPLTYREIRDLPPATVALRLRGPDRSADVERVETQPNWGMLPSTLRVSLFHRPTSIGERYCTQSVDNIVMFMIEHGPTPAVTDDAPLRIEHVDENSSLARAPNCRLHAGQRFAMLGVNTSVGVGTLDALAAAQAGAMGHGRLPFRLSCRDEVDRDPNRCRRGARRVLARLPLDLACRIGRDGSQPVVIEVTLCTDESLWTIRMRDLGTTRARLLMLWKDPAPF